MCFMLLLLTFKLCPVCFAWQVHAIPSHLRSIFAAVLIWHVLLNCFIKQSEHVHMQSKMKFWTFFLCLKHGNYCDTSFTRQSFLYHCVALYNMAIWYIYHGEVFVKKGITSVYMKQWSVLIVFVKGSCTWLS